MENQREKGSSLGSGAKPARTADGKMLANGIEKSGTLTKHTPAANGNGKKTSAEDSPSGEKQLHISTSSDANTPRRPGDEVEEFFELALSELAALRTRSEVEAINQAVELILECEVGGGRVHVTGVGKSEYVARYIASLFSSTGTPAYFLHATECVHGSAGQLGNSDIAIAISNSGGTPELMSAVEVLRELEIKIIGVSGNAHSALVASSDVFLYAGVDNEGGILNLAPRASILAESLVLSALSVALESRKGLTREQYARWHPGGALGRLARGD